MGNVSGGQLLERTFLTVAEVAEVMRVSKMTVYRLVHSGEMPAVRFGRSYRVPENAVEQYLKGAVVDGPRRIRNRLSGPSCPAESSAAPAERLRARTGPAVVGRPG